MIPITIQQRDLIQRLLSTPSPVAVADVADQMQLTPRQVYYRLKTVKPWLKQHEIILEMTPGVGVEVVCSPEQRFALLRQLDSQTNFQLALTVGQRRQLLALNLLMTNEPLILSWLQHSASVSRTTVLKDLKPVEKWLKRFGLELIRRPNYGVLITGPELLQRQALSALLWGDIPFGEPVTSMTHQSGFAFALADDITLLPMVQPARELLDDWDQQTALEWVAYAEAQQEGRFSDDAVLYLAMAFYIQAHRIRTGHYVAFEEETLDWLEGQSVWPISLEVAGERWSDLSRDVLMAEAAAIAVHLLAGIRDHTLPSALDVDPSLTDLVDALVQEVVRASNMSAVCHDSVLRDGLIGHIIPAVMRKRFNLWAPPSWSDGKLSRRYQYEYNIARELMAIVVKRTEVVLPENEIDTLILLIRAAFMRAKPHRLRRVYVVCPSGIATSHFLVARLRTRFPHLEILGVLSLRELSQERVSGAQLLISTVSLKGESYGLPVLQVNPLLLPQDIELITSWLT